MTANAKLARKYTVDNQSVFITVETCGGESRLVWQLKPTRSVSPPGQFPACLLAAYEEATNGLRYTLNPCTQNAMLAWSFANL